MDKANTDNGFDISQPFITTANAFPTSTFEGLEDFSQREQLHSLFEASQPSIQSHPWPVQSLDYDAFLLSHNDSRDLFSTSEPWLMPVPPGPQALGASFKHGSTHTMELELDNNHGIDSASLATVALEESQLICYEPGCDSQRIYATPSTFRKHQGKHTRPYACQSASCKFRRFGDKASLARHCREVHSSKVHYCPFRSCSRHTQGFARKNNLLNHQLRCHGDKPLDRQPGSSDPPLMRPLEDDDGLSEPGRSPSEDTVRGSETQSVTTAHSGGEDKIERKLRDLRAKRDKINRKIATLESAQALLGLN